MRFESWVRAARSARDSLVARRRNRLAQSVKKIIESKEQHHPLDSDDQFTELQGAYAPLPEYGYDPVSVWNRASERVENLINLCSSVTSSTRILEVGCGDGMVGRLLQVFGFDVVLVDIEDWRDHRARGVPFVHANVTTALPFASQSFDFIYSYNSFEHFPDPAHAFSEMVRVCSDLGHIYLDFGPLYSSPWGLHAYRTVRMPYAQFLFSEVFLKEKLDTLGISDLGRSSSELQHVNRWRVRQFESMWTENDVEVVHHARRLNDKYLDLILKYPAAFRGHDLAYEDLVTYALSVLLRRSRRPA